MTDLNLLRERSKMLLEIAGRTLVLGAVSKKLSAAMAEKADAGEIAALREELLAAHAGIRQAQTNLADWDLAQGYKPQVTT